MKYWRMQFEGERQADELGAEVGRSGGLLVRVHYDGKNTHAYVASDESIHEQFVKETSHIAPEEVDEQELTRIE